jgi:hypothetical protein
MQVKTNEDKTKRMSNSIGKLLLVAGAICDGFSNNMKQER